MDQSIIMIPMHNVGANSHCCIAKVRVSAGKVTVDMRASVLRTGEVLYLLTSDGSKQLSNGSAPFDGESIIGLAVMGKEGECILSGAIAGCEQSFEQALVSLRIKLQAKSIKIITTTQKQETPAKEKTAEIKTAPKPPVIEHVQKKSEKKPIEIVKQQKVEPIKPQIHEKKETIKKSAPLGEITESIDKPAPIIKCCRAMDGYTPNAQGMELTIEAERTKSEELTPKVKLGREELKPAQDASLDFPQVEGEELSWPAFNNNASRRKGAKAASQVKSDDSALLDLNPLASVPSEQIDMLRANLEPRYSAAPEDAMSPMPAPFIMPKRIQNPFMKQFPNSQWVKIQRIEGQGYYLEGRMKRGSESFTITAAPGEYSPVPPKHLQDFSRFINTKDGGFWIRMRKTK